VTVELGRTTMTVRDLLALSPGEVLELDRAAGSPADLLVNGRLIARGEVVVVDEDFGLRVTEIIDESAAGWRARAHGATERLAGGRRRSHAAPGPPGREAVRRARRCARAGAAPPAAVAQRLGLGHHGRQPRARRRLNRPPGLAAHRARPRGAGG